MGMSLCWFILGVGWETSMESIRLMARPPGQVTEHKTRVGFIHCS